MKKNHPFHLVTKRPWPLIISLNSFSLFSGIILIIQFKSTSLLLIRFLITLISSFQWWRDIRTETSLQGNHTSKVLKIIKIGIILFIISEVIFFLSFFWRFFHARLSPSIEIGIKWPPKGILVFNPIEIPLLNTIILLSSGLTITWAHHRILSNKIKPTKKALKLTIILGIYFSILQIWEYRQSPFTITDSIYGSSFFIRTGFHGLHVIVGTIFICSCLGQTIKFYPTINHHKSLELASWYWHFVDIVWLFLYISIYWWRKYFLSIISIIDFQSKG